MIVVDSADIKKRIANKVNDWLDEIQDMAKTEGEQVAFQLYWSAAETLSKFLGQVTSDAGCVVTRHELGSMGDPDGPTTKGD